MPEPTPYDRDLLISVNERLISLAAKLDEFSRTMKDNLAEMRSDNIRRDASVRAELNNLKKQYDEDIVNLQREHKEEIRCLNETVFMLKGAVALVYLLGVVVSIYSKFG
jgi:hypothetical protein